MIQNQVRKILQSLFLFLLLLVPSLGFGDEEFSHRKGFLIGFGPLVGYETNDLQRWMGGGEFRIGGGITDKILLYYEGSFAMTSLHSKTFDFDDNQVKAQFFLWKNLYLNFGVGATIGETSEGKTTTETDVGFITSAGFGNEFRLKRRFFVSPEATLSYRRIEKNNYIMPGLIFHMGWYF